SLLADDHKEHQAPASRLPAFEQFKALAGDWVGKEVGKEGMEVRVNYKVTSGGTAVVETLFPGSDHEMVTVIHPDGSDLLLTHYCVLGNQPQMKGSATAESPKIEFKFVRATNLKSENDMYMHDVTFTISDKDTFHSEWTHFKDGKPSGQA